MDTLSSCPGKCANEFRYGSEEWCRVWKPPDLPPPHTSMYKELIIFINGSATFKEHYTEYYKKCNQTVPVFPDFPDTGTSTTAAIPTSSTSSFITHAYKPSTTVSAASSGIAVLIVLLVLVSVAVLVGFLWWRHHKRRRVNIENRENQALPLEKYETISYLDNKAREAPNGQCCKNTTGQAPDGNESPSMKHNDGYYNETYENEMGENGAHSPGVSSDTPLFGDQTDGNIPFIDDMDGSPLPNVPGVNHQLSPEKNDLKRNGDTPVSHRLPPIIGTDTGIGQNGTENPDSVKKRLPKKKRSISSRISKHKSAPVSKIEDILDDMGGNRNSV